MEIKTFDTILTGICDTFDSLVTPKKILRTNTNVIYLMFKAVAKGYEIINNVCVALSNKFNPMYCSEKDLESVASLVGTERLLGSASGLRITIVNNTVVPIEMDEGSYFYELDADTRFVFTLNKVTEIPAQGSVIVTALSENKGRFPVTSQVSITVESMRNDYEINENLTFACSDNTALLGYADETNTDFRKRILTDTDRQDIISEIETKIRNLPYIYDCNVIFNDSDVSIDYPSSEEAEFKISPYHMLIILSGDFKDEIARIVAENGLYPTVGNEGSTELKYYNDVFARGYYSVNVNAFKYFEYSIKVYYKYDTNYSTEDSIQAQMRTILFNTLNGNTHSDAVTEHDIYKAIENGGFEGLQVLNTDLFVSGSKVNFVSVPKTRIPVLVNVTFEAVN